MSEPAKDHALSGYGFWLVPSSATEEPLRKLVADLASKQTSPPSPAFIPHITLLTPRGAIRTVSGDMKLQLGLAVSSWVKKRGHAGGFRVKLGKPQKGDRYYQCVLAPVEDSDELADLRKHVENEIGEEGGHFFPHLSLLYGDLAEDRKDELVEEAQKAATWPMEVELREAVVVDLHGTASEWKIFSRALL